MRPLTPPALRALLSVALVATSACATRVPRVPGPLGRVGVDPPDVALRQRPADRPADRGVHDDDLGPRVAAAARHWLTHTPRGFRDDCSGFVAATLDRVGLQLDGSTQSMWETMSALGSTHKQRRPAVGDLVFFDNTYDRNRNGRWDDDLTHIGVVIEVEPNDTVVIAHGGTSRGRTTMRMNLHQASVRHGEDGAVLNDYLRARRANDPARAVYLSGELWRGFASLSGQPTVALASPR